MQKMNNAKTMANYIDCLSLLEHNVALLYKKLSEKTEIPLAKSLLFSIAQDSSKHSALLKGVASSISKPDAKSSDCTKRLGPTWHKMTAYLNEVTKIEEGKLLTNSELYEKLVELESGMGEEYYIFIQMQTLQFMSEKIHQLYNVNLETVKGVFENIISDEERHREILAKIKEMFESNKEDNDSSPKVKYLNPDGWINYTPLNSES
jgi:hypothetical protein